MPEHEGSSQRQGKLLLKKMMNDDAFFVDPILNDKDGGEKGNELEIIS